MGQLAMGPGKPQLLQDLLIHLRYGTGRAIGKADGRTIPVAVMQIDHLRCGRLFKLQIKSQLADVDLGKGGEQHLQLVHRRPFHTDRHIAQ